MSNIGKNIVYLRKKNKWTQDDLASILKVKRSLIGSYEEERASPKLDLIYKMIELFDISMEDLVSKNLGETTTKDDYTSRRLLMKLNSTAKDNSIVFVPMKAAAGYLNGYADPEFLDELNTFTLPMIAPGNYRAFEIVGDSMLPTPSGSVVIAEREESFDNIKPTNAYILLSKNEGIVYKRISKVNETKELSLISDNPVFHPYKVKYTDVLEMWKAVYVLNKADEMINLSKGIRD